MSGGGVYAAHTFDFVLSAWTQLIIARQAFAGTGPWLMMTAFPD
jgi:hypothetical protein